MRRENISIETATWGPIHDLEEEDSRPRGGVRTQAGPRPAQPPVVILEECVRSPR